MSNAAALIWALERCSSDLPGQCKESRPAATEAVMSGQGDDEANFTSCDAEPQQIVLDPDPDGCHRDGRGAAVP
ncbi:hypothetical protein LX32DRAFT_418031 [Colletotrichum zoysiae]|uniref:Uncharacterized protein n=1 Tax=Colletotrichum zoysiae TaxID=1216348 RepID=A0AAD9HTW3_9PEZI|nr:hypothetical protein LX32DRAFT_418031 [Colletotrichum zoysiae]